MISKYSHGELNWIDLESPTNEEIDHVVEKYSIPSHIEDKLKISKNDDEISIEDDFTVAIINLPRIQEHIITDSNNMIFVFGNNIVLTVHNKKIEAINKLGKDFESDILIEDKSKIKSSTLLFAYLLKNLYLNSETKIIENGIKIQMLEKQIFKNSKKLKILIFLSIILLVVSIILLWL